MNRRRFISWLGIAPVVAPVAVNAAPPLRIASPAVINNSARATMAATVGKTSGGWKIPTEIEQECLRKIIAAVNQRYTA